MATFKWQIRNQRKMMAWNVILMATAVLHVVYGQTVPCVDFKDIPEVARRNPSIPTQGSGAPINDRTLPDGWYGAANYALEDSAPGFLRCGALLPIWRQSISGTTATMCIQGPSNTCSNSFTVQVEDCNGYTVYNLKASPLHKTAYCFREITPNAPTYRPKPTVVPDTTDTGVINSDLLFRCTFPPSSNQRLFHQTTWYVNDVVVHQHPPMLMDTAYFDNTGITQAKLSAEGITQIGFNIKCEVRAMYGVSLPQGPKAVSDPFYAGFEILTKEITIKQGETGQVRVRATAPFRCGIQSEEYRSFCSMPIEIQNLKPNGFSQSDCAISIHYTQWNQPVSVTVHGTITPTYGRGQLDYPLVLRTPEASLLFPYWANHAIGTVKVTVYKDNPVKRKSCSSDNDPYVRQFDKIKLTLQMEGRFTLYKLASQLIEIQIEVQKCTRGTGYCNCGVAVQSGKTVFSINSCDTRSWRIQHHGCDDSGNAMEIKKRYSIYDIYLPTGARVRVETFTLGNGKNALNVGFPGTILDTLASRGLCGQLSDTLSDDFIMRDETRGSNVNSNAFFTSWRVGTHDLFDTDYVTTLTTLQRLPPKYCLCKGGTKVTCSPLATMNTPVTPNHYKDVPCAIHGNRKKRMVRNRNIDHRYKRQTSAEVWNNQTAAEFCNNLFAASTTVQLCSNVPGVDTNRSRDDCISDIMLSGTTDFQMMSIGTVRTSCETEVFLNPDLWVTDPNNPGAPTVFDTITNNVCPNDCSNRGTCNKGLCICSAGFGSADCSVDLTQPPVLDEAEDNGHCDLATSNCQMLTVFGLTFLEDAAIKCRATKFTVGNGGSLNEPDTQVSDGTERSLSEVGCPVRVDAPRGIVTAYNISVANIDNIYSESVEVLVYDSTCVTVDHESKIWTVKNGYTLQNGVCIRSDNSSGPDSTTTARSTQTSTPTSTTTSTTTSSGPDSTTTARSTPTSTLTSTTISTTTSTTTSSGPDSTTTARSTPTSTLTSTTISTTTSSGPDSTITTRSTPTSTPTSTTTSTTTSSGPDSTTTARSTPTSTLTSTTTSTTTSSGPDIITATRSTMSSKPTSTTTSSGPDNTTTKRSPTSKPIIDVTDSVVIPTTTNANYKITMSYVTLLASIISGVLSLALRDF